MNWYVFLLPATIMLISFIASWVKVKSDDKKTIPYDYMACRGVASTSLHNDEDGVVTIKDVRSGLVFDKTLIARSYCDMIKKDSIVVVVQYDYDKKVHMVEPYV